MEAKITKITVNRNCINPELLIHIVIDYHKTDELPIHIGGYLMSSDRKKIATLNEHQSYRNRSINFTSQVFHSPRHKEIYIEKNLRNKSHEGCLYILSAELSPKVISHIEHLREKDSKKEVRFWISIDYVKTEVKFEQSDLKSGFSTDFISLTREYEDLSFTINQSDWIREYSSQLGIGDFFLLEMKLPDTINVEDEWAEMFERMAENITKMKEKLRSSDWEGVMLYARLFHEDIRFKRQSKPVRDKLKAKYEIRNGSELGFEEMYGGINSYFDFLSKFKHDKDRNDNFNIKPIPKIEDAYMALNLSIGLMYLMSKKLEVK